MSVFNLSTIGTGSPFPTVKPSNTLAIDFLSLAIGADALPVIQTGTGAGAYFDFAARKLSSSFAAVGANDLTNKAAVDALISAQAAIRVAAEGTLLPLAGGTLTGALTLAADPTLALHAATKQYADLKLALAGGTMSGAIAMGAFKITGLANGATGTQDAASVAQVESLIAAIPGTDLTPYFKKDGTVVATGAFDMGTFKIGNAADPSLAQDLATKNYVDLKAIGLSPKKSARVTSLVNIAIASALINGSTIDGIVVATGDRVLLQGQTLPAENGLYVVVASGAASRALDMDSLSPIDEINGAWVPVQEGTANAGKIFVQYGTVVTLGTTAINFEFYNPLAQLVGGDMITNSGSTFSVDVAAAGGLESSNPGNVAGQLQIKLDGATLAKSGTGLKVAAAGVTATEIAAAALSASGGLTGGAGTAISANVDSSLKIVANAIGVQYGSAKINDNAGTISANQIVYIKPNGHVDLATKANAISDCELGVVQDATIATTASGLVIFKRGAEIGGFSGLTPGAEYFINTSGVMALYSAITYVASDNVYSLGKALDATTLIYNPSYKFSF